MTCHVPGTAAVAGMLHVVERHTTWRAITKRLVRGRLAVEKRGSRRLRDVTGVMIECVRFVGATRAPRD